MRILVAAVISETLLLGAALLMSYLSGHSHAWNASVVSVLWGVVWTVPPLIVNHILWRYSDRHPDTIYGRFSREIVTPLCRAMTLRVAIVVAVLSGVCEELFFRGTLNALISAHLGTAASCILTSFLFAGVHFIGNFTRYGAMLPLYTAMGMYLWSVHYVSGSLATAAVTHGVYNFVVILLVKLNPAPVFFFTHRSLTA